MKFKKAKQKADGTKPPVDIAIPTYGYQNHVAIDAGFGFIRRWQTTDAALYDGTVLRKGLLDKTNTAGKVWADTAYRSQENERFMDDNGFVSCAHRKKPKGKPMSEATRRANNLKSKVRSTSSTSLPKRRAEWGCSSGPSASPGRQPRLVSPTSSTTSNG